ncbi:hypothetical protein GOV04_02300 [Candidatus Woesearchaeota archaeon]|nr:hypothetical protein [Candidatus Woesearchaeota archaeon]
MRSQTKKIVILLTILTLLIATSATAKIAFVPLPLEETYVIGPLENTAEYTGGDECDRSGGYRFDCEPTCDVHFLSNRALQYKPVHLKDEIGTIQSVRFARYECTATSTDSDGLVSCSTYGWVTRTLLATNYDPDTTIRMGDTSDSNNGINCWAYKVADVDLDNDGLLACTAEELAKPINERVTCDCDDSDSAKNNVEICEDTIDNDCDTATSDSLDDGQCVATCALAEAGSFFAGGKICAEEELYSNIFNYFPAGTQGLFSTKSSVDSTNVNVFDAISDGANWHKCIANTDRTTTWVHQDSTTSPGGPSTNAIPDCAINCDNAFFIGSSQNNQGSLGGGQTPTSIQVVSSNSLLDNILTTEQATEPVDPTLDDNQTDTGQESETNPRQLDEILPDASTDFNDVKNRFNCYYEDGIENNVITPKGVIAECCGDSFDDCTQSNTQYTQLNPNTKIRRSGMTPQILQDYYGGATENAVLQLLFNSDYTSGPYAFSIPHYWEGVNYQNANSIPSLRITNWQDYQNLEFDIFLLTSNELKLMIYKDDGTHDFLDDINSYVQGGDTNPNIVFNDKLIAYSTNGNELGRWHHIKIPLSLIDTAEPIAFLSLSVDNNVLRSNVEQTFGNDRPFQSETGVNIINVIGLDRLILTNVDTQICAGDTNLNWITNDLDQDAWACNGVTSFGHTGLTGQDACCGDDGDFNTKEYSSGGDYGGCWNNNYVAEDTIIPIILRQ